MEIARRFFPSEDKSIIRYNPLRNSMPEWLPERFLTGDPFTSLPKGEMRMPGKGYETLNDLHPDEFGRYNCQIKIVRIAGNSLELISYQLIIAIYIRANSNVFGAVKRLKDWTIRSEVSLVIRICAQRLLKISNEI